MHWKKLFFCFLICLFTLSCQRYEGVKHSEQKFSDFKNSVLGIQYEVSEEESGEENLLEEESLNPIEDIALSSLKQRYQEMQLQNLISYELFEQAVKGMNHIKRRKKNLLTIVDFSRSANEERLFILDLDAKKILLKSLVSHGKGSGEVFATSFSNKSGSNKSSHGFFLTGSSYRGKNGFSLRLHGLERGVNHLAYNRTLVIHAADYVCERYIETNGRLGRSKGCFAVPEDQNRKIIDLIANRTVLYAHSKGLKYQEYSFEY